MNHQFHFVVNEKMFFKIIKIANEQNKSISNTIVVLFENMIPFVEKNHLMSKEKESKYQVIADPKEDRYHVHCYMPESSYRKLKQIHQDLNTYSLGQILRKIIEYFIMGCFKYGLNEFLAGLGGIKKIWVEKKNIYIIKKKKFNKQLLYRITNFPSFITTYDNNSRPLCMQLLL